MNKQSPGFIARMRAMRTGSMVLLMVILAANNCWFHSQSINGTTGWHPIELVFRTIVLKMRLTILEFG